MIASEKDNMDLDGAGQQRRNELDALLIRNGETATINDNTRLRRHLQRRLFERTAPAEVSGCDRAHVHNADDGTLARQGVQRRPATATRRVLGRGRSLLPLPPPAHGTRQAGVAKLAGFQRVRSTIRIFAATAHSLYKRGKAGKWTPLLVGPGDLPCQIP